MLDPQKAIDAVSRVATCKHASDDEGRAQNPRRSEHRKRFGSDGAMHDLSGEHADLSDCAVPLIYHTVCKCGYRVVGRHMVRDVPNCHAGMPVVTRCHSVSDSDVHELGDRDVDDDYEVRFRYTPSLFRAKRRRIGLMSERRLQGNIAIGESEIFELRNSNDDAEESFFVANASHPPPWRRYHLDNNAELQDDYEQADQEGNVIDPMIGEKKTDMNGESHDSADSMLRRNTDPRKAVIEHSACCVLISAEGGRAKVLVIRRGESGWELPKGRVKPEKVSHKPQNVDFVKKLEYAHVLPFGLESVAICTVRVKETR